MEKSYAGIGIVVVIAVIAVGSALAVPTFMYSKSCCIMVTGPPQTLKSIASTQATWFNSDTDRNGIKDYWTADLSGFYRVEDATGNAVMVIDISFARADWNPVPAGGVTPVVGAPVTHVNNPVAKSGYYYAAFLFDESSRAYAQDLNGDGFAYENADRYAFQTFPDRYGSSGKLAFIINESAAVYMIEAIAQETGRNMGRSFNSQTMFEPAASPGSVPMPFWPAKDPTAAGYGNVE